MPSVNRRFDTPLSAFLTVLRDQQDQTGLLLPSPSSERLDGKTCLITGANSGLGRAIAFELAKRGARLFLAIRDGKEETAQSISEATGNHKIDTFSADLSDLTSVNALIDELSNKDENIDRLILNAGLMASSARKTPQGYEEMFAVHYLANYQLITRLAERGHLAQSHDGSPARVIAISSEAHRSGTPIDPKTFGQVNPHTFNSALKQYGHTKLAMSLMMHGLNAQHNDELEAPKLCFFQSSPGPVATQIARSAPWFIKPLSKIMLPLLFASPEKASAPAIYLACSPEIETQTGRYMHLMRFKQPSADATHPVTAKFVLEFAEAACQAHGL